MSVYLGWRTVEILKKEKTKKEMKRVICKASKQWYQSCHMQHCLIWFQDKLPYEEHIAKQMANKPLLFSRCLLRTQKLSESRCEGEIVEPTNEGMCRSCSVLHWWQVNLYSFILLFLVCIYFYITGNFDT